MRETILALGLALALAACSDGDGKDEFLPTGPQVNLTNVCPRQQTQGDTNVNVTIDCPNDSRNQTAEPFVVE